MSKATVTSKGQITIPKDVRDALGLETGHRVSFLLREDGVVEMHPDSEDLVTLKDMERAVREGAAEE
jgi:antitoxin PrlF